MLPCKRLTGMIAAFAIVAGAFLTAAAGAASTVSVVVNGQPVSFDQPPIERAGRVFVPLRGVFERLGASVVYDNGAIDAQGNGRSVSLHIGSTQATVNGQAVYMDVAPFLVGARTLVPLRFVAQALGAAVQWSQSNSTVYIVGSGSVAPAQPANASFYLKNERPATTIYTFRPAIHANFSEPVNRDSVRVSIDGRDVTADVYANAAGFDVTAPFPLYAGRHTVSVTGTTQAGSTFSAPWSFTTQTGSSENYIRNITPSAGSTVGSAFTLAGATLPGSTVHVVASGEASAFGGLFQIGTGTFQVDVHAGANGYFSVPISLNAVSGGHVRVIVQSVAPSGASIEQQVVYST